jgi:hypothetical protein
MPSDKYAFNSSATVAQATTLILPVFFIQTPQEITEDQQAEQINYTLI